MKMIPANEKDLLVLSGWFFNESEVRNWGGPLIHFPLTIDQLKIDIEWDIADSYAFVGEDGNLIGFAQAFNKFGYRHLGRIVISPQMRGKKLGDKLMNVILNSADESDLSFSLFVYEDNISAKKLYQRLGFKVQTYPAERQKIKGCSFMVKNTS